MRLVVLVATVWAVALQHATGAMARVESPPRIPLMAAGWSSSQAGADWTQSRRRRFPTKRSNHDALAFLESEEDASTQVQQCSSSSSLAYNLLRGAFLRVTSDLSLGTPLESIKCRVTGTSDNCIQSYRNIIKEGGFGALWTGTPSRTVEGSLLGAMFILGSTVTKKQVTALGGGPTLAALAGGLVGGVMQSIVMTPAGMIFTSLNLNKKKPGHENDNAISVTRRVMQEKGIVGMYFGVGPMVLRQATNWASRSCFTEIARTTFRMSEYGLLGEIGSGVIGGVGSCWNTPIETIRVIMQFDVSAKRPTKSFTGYWDAIVEENGYAGLFRGVTPRAVQAVWQTVFMVVVPNILGM